jgi:hypothetical protein
MTAKKMKTSQGLRTMLRQASGRYATKFTPGGREKKPKRPMPSLPKLKCLETSDLKLEDRQR